MSSGFMTLYGRRTLLLAPFTVGAEWSNLYMGLMTVFPDASDDGDTVIEVASHVLDSSTLGDVNTGYSRVAMPAVDPDTLQLRWQVSNGGSIVYAAEVRFDNALVDWGAVAAWGLFTASTSGELVAAGAVDEYVRGPLEPEDDEDVPVGSTIVVPAYGVLLEVASYV